MRCPDNDRWIELLHDQAMLGSPRSTSPDEIVEPAVDTMAVQSKPDAFELDEPKNNIVRVNKSRPIPRERSVSNENYFLSSEGIANE